MNPPQTPFPTVAIAGGGLAGLAAGCALSSVGFRVTLFEKRPYLGGRASSYEHPGTGEVVDNCQHVLLGCCTNLIDFYRRTGVEQRIRWYDELVFLEPGGRESVIRPSVLPAPMHAAPSFLRARSLSLSDKVAIGRVMAALAPSLPDEQGETFLSWLKRHGQTDRAIDRFWKTILVSALNEDLDRTSVPYAAQVIRESFMKSAAAGRMGIPSMPLSELYGAAGDTIRSAGGDVHFRAGVDSFSPQLNGVMARVNGQEHRFDYLILAVPFDVLSRLLPDSADTALLRENLGHFETSPITGIHLWYDRQITDRDHAVLLDRTIQWMFHKSRLIAGRDNGAGSYVELVVSSSKSLVEKSRGEIIEMATRELQEFFPVVRQAKLVKSTVIKEVNATYSPAPGIDAYRPRPETAWPRVFLAGDFVATGWPATMEGAVRSGYMSAESLAKSAAVSGSRFLVQDLRPSGLMRWFG